VGNPTNTTFVITGPAPGYVERGVRTNFLRVYGDQNKISPSQLPLRVEPVWDEESRLYRWEFTLNTVTSTKILIEEIEDTGPENSERKIASFSINLGKS
jgi:hypothetical protein